MQIISPQHRRQQNSPHLATPRFSGDGIDGGGDLDAAYAQLDADMFTPGAAALPASEADQKLARKIRHTLTHSIRYGHRMRAIKRIERIASEPLRAEVMVGGLASQIQMGYGIILTQAAALKSQALRNKVLSAALNVEEPRARYMTLSRLDCLDEEGRYALMSDFIPKELLRRGELSEWPRSELIKQIDQLSRPDWQKTLTALMAGQPVPDPEAPVSGDVFAQLFQRLDRIIALLEAGNPPRS